MAASKKIKKFSKTTLGTTVETVSDYVDVLSQIMVEYVNQKYRVKQKVEDMKMATLNTLYSVKRGFIRTLVESLFLVTGILALIVGAILILKTVIPLEYVFIGYGFVVTIGVLFAMKTKA